MEIYIEAIEVFEVCLNIVLVAQNEKSILFKNLFSCRKKGKVAGKCSQ